MDIASGSAEQHPSVLPVDTSHSPAVVGATPRYPSGNQPGGTVTDISGVDFEADARAAQSAAMAADADRRGRYAASMAPLGASAGDTMTLPGVVSDIAQHTGGTNATSYDPAG